MHRPLRRRGLNIHKHLTSRRSVTCLAGALREAATHCQSHVEDSAQLLRNSLTPLQRSTVKAAMVMDMNARDTTAELAEKDVTDVTSFEWQSTLRSYWQVLPRFEREQENTWGRREGQK